MESILQKTFDTTTSTTSQEAPDLNVPTPSARDYITLTEYAKLNGITYEAVRISIKKKYWDDLYPEHIVDTKPMLLDSYAVSYLDEKRSHNKAVRMTPLNPSVVPSDKTISLMEQGFFGVSEALSTGFSGVNENISKISSVNEENRKSLEDISKSLSSVSDLSSRIDSFSDILNKKDDLISQQNKEISNKDREIQELKARLAASEKELSDEKSKSAWQKLFGK